jgi:LuxR family maltose regulon positive regulatory protein
MRRIQRTKPGTRSPGHDEQLLVTKLFAPPARPRLVARPRLTRQLDAVTGHKLTVISAAAGYGKTTLLSEWARSGNVPVAWLSLGPEDNDPVRFWSYVVASIQACTRPESKVQSPKSGRGDFGLWTSGSRPGVTALVNRVAAFPEQVVLALDDYHLIESQAIHDGVSFLLDHMPPTMHLVIAGRTEPPLLLNRLRARDELLELHAADLRFMPDEAERFLADVMSLDLEAGGAALLESQTEGWVAGLQLAALALKGGDNLAGQVRGISAGHPYILGYITDEVLRRQPGEVQAFLLQTSILDRFCAPLCDAIMGEPGSDGMIRVLESANLFIVPLDAEGRWYRYHYLFAEFLRAQLVQTRPQQASDLHRRASAWFEERKLTSEAIKHALAAEDFEWAAGLIDRAAEVMVQRGELVTITAWLDALPEQMVRARPGLSIWYAWMMLLTGQVDAVEPRLLDAERGTRARSDAVADSENPPPVGWLNPSYAQIAIIRAFVAGTRGEPAEAIRYSSAALDYLNTGPDMKTLRSLALMNLGQAHYLRGEIDAATTVLIEAQAISRPAGLMYNTVGASGYLAALQIAKGRLHHAHKLYRQALRLSLDGDGQPLPPAVVAYAGLGSLEYEWNHLDEAWACLLQGIGLGEASGEYGPLIEGYITLARVRSATGDAKSAQEMLDKAEQVALRSGPNGNSNRVAAWRARLCLAVGDLQAAVRWAREFADEAGLEATAGMNLPLPYSRRMEHATLVRVLMAEGNFEEAHAQLMTLRQDAEAGGRLGESIELLALEALAWRARGRAAQALRALGQALSLAEPEGYVRTFVDEGQPMAALLRAYEREATGRAQRYTRRLLEAFPEERATLAALVEPLTEREIEVLLLLAGNLSYQSIARKLIVTENTARWHIKNIYRKLHVNRRAAAVERATALGFLS